LNYKLESRDTTSLYYLTKNLNPKNKEKNLNPKHIIKKSDKRVKESLVKIQVHKQKPLVSFNVQANAPLISTKRPQIRSQDVAIWPHPGGDLDGVSFPPFCLTGFVVYL